MKRTFILLIIVNAFEALHIYLRNILIPILDNTYSNNFHWGLISYFNNYSIDFYRRSIVGTLMDLVNFAPTLHNLIFLKFIFLSIFGILFSIFFKKLRNTDFFLIALSPFFFQQFIFSSLAVNDLLSFIFFISSLLAIKSNKKNLLFILMPLGITNHLLFSIFFCPLIIYYLFKNKDFLAAKLQAFVWVLLTCVFAFFGKFDLKNLPYLKSNILQNGFKIDEHDFYFVINTNSFFDDVKFSLGYINYALGNIARASTFCILIILSTMFFLRIKSNLIKIKIPMIILTISLLSMFLLGFDYPRWIGLYLAVSLILLSHEGEFKISNKFRYFLMFFGILGPIGTSDGFPLLFKIIINIL